ncbi:MAG: GspH/FimT family pseudopilin [Alphaproteobacteria bacterium]|nr:GspH/FimT family pseudopilin [Alphaproteobacteria bacterium]
MTSWARRARATSGGFTLIELLVVLVILALVTGAVAERAPGRRVGVQGRAIAREVSDLLRLARATAIGENRPVAVVLEPDGHRLIAIGLPPRVVPAPFVARMEAATRENVIVFAPDGSATGGRIDIASGANHWPITIETRTGRVSLARAL